MQIWLPDFTGNSYFHLRFDSELRTRFESRQKVAQALLDRGDCHTRNLDLSIQWVIQRTVAIHREFAGQLRPPPDVDPKEIAWPKYRRVCGNLGAGRLRECHSRKHNRRYTKTADPPAKVNTQGRRAEAAKSFAMLRCRIRSESSQTRLANRLIRVGRCAKWRAALSPRSRKGATHSGTIEYNAAK